MSIKDDLTALVGSHLPLSLWNKAKKAKYVLRIGTASNAIDRKLSQKIKDVHGVCKFYVRRRKHETVYMFILSERFFDGNQS